MKDNVKKCSLLVTLDYGTDSHGFDYPFYHITIIDRNGNKLEHDFWIRDKVAIIKAIFDVNFNDNIYVVDDHIIFRTALDLMREYVLSDSKLREIFRIFDFNDRFALQNYTIAYITLLLWMRYSTVFMAQSRELFNIENIRHLDTIYMNEWVRRTLSDDKHYCGIKLGCEDIKTSINDIQSKEDKETINEALDAFIEAVNDMIFISDEEMSKIEDLTGLLDDISEDMNEGDAIIIKGKLPDDDKGPIN